MSDGRDQYFILVVEDTPEFATLTIMTLQRFGFDPVLAEDGEQAVALLDQYRPDLILLDLNLPGMSGWQVLEHVQNLYGHIPCIVTSAYSDSANRVVGRLQDVYRYLIKPFAPGDLIKAVEGALGLSTAS